MRALEFFGGIDFESIFESEAPALGGGIVSAAAAKERNWNRRKQSMMWAPMPEQYSATDGAALAPVPVRGGESGGKGNGCCASGGRAQCFSAWYSTIWFMMSHTEWPNSHAIETAQPQ